MSGTNATAPTMRTMMSLRSTGRQHGAPPCDAHGSPRREPGAVARLRHGCWRGWQWWDEPQRDIAHEGDRHRVGDDARQLGHRLGDVDTSPRHGPGVTVSLRM